MASARSALAHASSEIACPASSVTVNTCITASCNTPGVLLEDFLRSVSQNRRLGRIVISCQEGWRLAVPQHSRKLVHVPLGRCRAEERARSQRRRLLRPWSSAPATTRNSEFPVGLKEGEQAKRVPCCSCLHSVATVPPG